MGSLKTPAVILAGGKGKRLKHLTANKPKPLLDYGGFCRIIDFTLSNCSNSGISHVMILVQFQESLMRNYLGCGSTWNFSSPGKNFMILSPDDTPIKHLNKYCNTADAVYKNLYFLEKLDCENVIILAGDHIYHMDYGKMIEFHKSEEADVTIAVKKVTLNEASRFGVMETEGNKIIDFQEKPDNPRSPLISMGIYVFKYGKLREYLKKDHHDMDSSHDFGGDIIPFMLEEGCDLKAFTYDGYWKDIGTLESYWTANLNLLNGKFRKKMLTKRWPLYSRKSRREIEYIDASKSIENSIVNSTASIEGRAVNSIILDNSHIGPNSKIDKSLIMPETEIEDGEVLEKSLADREKYVRF